MSQRYVSLTSFKFGLDARRDSLSSVPGTLAQLLNAFINEGGEIEQRQSFVKDVNAYPTNTFGLQDTDAGLVTFGSDVAPNAALPTGVTYQRLAAPSGAGQFATVVFSCNYLGKAFVLCTFDNSSNVFMFYNGTLIGESRAGQVLPADTNTTLAQELADQFNALPGWFAQAENIVQGGVAVNHTGGLIVESPPQVHFTPITSVVSASGILAAALVDQNGTGTAAKAASVAFTLNAGTNGNVTLTAPANSDGSGTAQISGGAVAFSGSLALTCQSIATAVNLFGPTTGYKAVVAGTTVTIYAPASFGNVTFNLTVVTTGDITTTAGVVTTQFSVSVTPAFVDVIKVVTGTTQSANVVGHCQAATTGSAGAVTYLWQECNPDGTVPVTVASGINLSGTNTSYATFAKNLLRNTDIQGYFLLTATDAGGAPGSPSKRTVQVHLECDNNL